MGFPKQILFLKGFVVIFHNFAFFNLYIVQIHVLKEKIYYNKTIRNNPHLSVTDVQIVSVTTAIETLTLKLNFAKIKTTNQ